MTLPIVIVLAPTVPKLTAAVSLSVAKFKAVPAVLIVALASPVNKPIASSVVKTPAAGVPDPEGGGEAKIVVILAGVNTVFVPRGVLYGETTSAFVAR